MGVDHGCFNILVAEKFLYGADIIAVLKEMCGEGMAESVRADLFVYFCKFGCPTDGFLQGTGVHVMTHGLFCIGVNGKVCCREKVLPCPFFGGVWKFAGQGVREVNFSKALSEVFLVDEGYGLEMQVEVGNDRVGKDAEAVILAFSVTYDQLMVAKVDIFDTKPEAFRKAHA